MIRSPGGDNPGDDDRRPVVRFVPDRRFTAARGVGALVAALIAVFDGDPPGRTLAAVAAVLLAAWAVSDVVFSPRLVVTGGGVAVRSPLLRTSLRWDEIDAVRADEHRHRGLRSVALEIDAGDVLVVLGRRSIGMVPDRAAELINSFRPR